MPDRLLTLRAVARLLSVPSARIRCWVAAGLFPRPVVLPDGRERWRAAEVTAWMGRLAGVAPPPSLADLTATPVVPATPQAAAAGPVSLSELDELSQDFLQVLYEGGDWMSSTEIVAKLGWDVDRDTRRFKEARDALRNHRPPLIETRERVGCRITAAGTEAIESGLSAQESGLSDRDNSETP